MNTSRVVFFCITLFLFSTTGYAQYGHMAYELPGSILRFELGYVNTGSTADYSGKLRLYDNGAYLRDSAHSQTVGSTGFGVSFGTFHPIARLGKVSMLTLSITGMYNQIKWQNIGENIYQGTNLSITGQTRQLSLPVGFDFKFGCDATMNKNNRFCASIGAGATPTYSFTDIEAHSVGKASFHPFLKFEAGVLAGLCMKVRVIYSFLNVEYVNEVNTSTEDDNLAESFTLTGNPPVSVSFIIMPFSWAWQRHGWWDTYQRR